MAEENIGGLSAEVSGDASRLWSVLQQSELRMREFIAHYGNVNLQIRANIQIPSATAVLDARRSISRLFRDPAAGQVMLPTQFALPSQTETNKIVKGLMTQIGAISVKVIGNFEWGQRPPGTIPVQVTPGGTGPVSRPVAPTTAIAAQGGPRTITRKGGPGQRTYYSDGTSAFEPTGGGLVGGGGGFAVGGMPMGGGPAGFFGGINRFGYLSGQENSAELAQFQEDAAAGAAIRRQQQAVVGGFRPGQAGGMARARQQAEAEAAGYQREQGRFIKLGTVPTQPVVQRPTAATTVAARQGPEIEVPIYQPPTSGNTFDRQHELDALMGDLGPEEEAAAHARAGNVNYGRRRSKGAAHKMPTRKVGLEERESIIASTPELEEGEKARVATQTRLIAARQSTTVRAPGTFLSGLISNMMGGAEARETQTRASEAGTVRDQLRRQLVGARATERDLEKKYYESGKSKEVYKDLDAHREVVGKLATDYVKATENATNLGIAAQQAAKGGVRNLAAGFIGGIAGGLAFGAGMTVLISAIGLLDKAFAPIFERMTGFVGLSNKIVDSLSDQARAQHGLTGIAVAGAFAQAGLGDKTANSIRPFIEQRVAVEAGNKAFQEQFDLIKAGVQLRANPNLGITTGTGGFLGTPLFQTPGTIEQLASLTPRGTLPQQIGDVFGAAGGFIGRGFRPPTTSEGIADLSKQTKDRTEALNLAITDLGEAAKRGAPDVSNLATITVAATDKLADATKELLLQVGAGQDGIEDWANALRDSNFALTGPNGAVASAEQFRDFFKAAQRGAAITPSGDATAQLRNLTIPAQLYQLRATADLQRGMNQIQFAAQRAAQPFLPFGTSIPGGRAALSPQAQAIMSGATDIDQLNVTRIAVARADIKELLSPFGAATQRAGVASFDRLQALGQQGAGLQSFIVQSQVNLATAQYNEQLRIATRQQSDLLQLTKQEGATRGDNLGYLQRQVIDEQRISQQLSLQSEQLSIQLQQRQLNFQVALAGFTAPGATPAERAARIEEAKIEAGFAQKQLDIRKEQASIAATTLPLQFKIEDTQFRRALTDIGKQIGLITQARQVTIDVAGAQEALARVNAEIDLAAKEFQTYAQAAEGAAVGVIGHIASLMAVYGGQASQWFSAISTAYADAFVKYIQRATGAIIESIDQLNGLGGRTTEQVESGRYAGKTVPLQSGFLGSVNRATTMTVGEAGNETVAILRNPREMAVNSGGTGQQINVSVVVTGNTVRSDDDLNQLVARITSEVEKSISRKISLLGGRGAAVS